MRSSFFIAFVVVTVIDAIALLLLKVPFDWFMLPISLCGLIAITEISSLVKARKRENGRLPLVFYFYCTIFFATYLAPITHFAINFWLMANNSLVLPDRWEPWVLIIGILNFIGLLFFKVVYHFFLNKQHRNIKLFLPTRKNNRYFYIYLMAVVSFFFQIFIYAKLGGVSGYINTYETRTEDKGFSGFGILFIISEFFPIILIFLYYIKAQHNATFRSSKVVFTFLFILFVACMFFGGLRGSRSNTILTLLHACMLIHFFLRKFSIKEMVVGTVFLMTFMYIYKFYKQGGSEAVKAYAEGTVDTQDDKYDFNMYQLLLNDFARGDIQPYLIYRYENCTYEPKYGLTYLGGVLHYFPSAVLDYKGPTKKTAATELLYGRKGESLGWFSTRIYGMLGEYILNFGYWTAFLVYVPLGIFLAFLDRWVASLQREDVRNFMIPLLIILIIMLFSADLDNLVFFFMKRIFLVLVMIKLGSDKYWVKKLVPQPFSHN